jgi:ribonuclease VapC
MPDGPSSCVIDTSALAAILAREPDATGLVEALGFYPHRILPPSCIVELCSLRSLRIDMPAWLAEFIAEYDVAVLPMDAGVAWLAASAAARYGRGSGHAAKLNFGDCMSYAFALHLDAPLLFKGLDFIHTDVAPALMLD